MTSINFDAVLLPENISFDIYKKLILLLNENDEWRKVAEYFGVFSDNDIQYILKSLEPAEKLIFELGSRLCTIEIFCTALEKCQLFNILLLFKTYFCITEQSALPEDCKLQMVTRGEKFILFVKAIGIPPPKYQWFCDNVELKEKNESTLVLENFGPNSEGEYYCVVNQEGYESIVSNSFNLILAPESPVILLQPSKEEICSVGSSVSLLVKAKGHPKIQYQWYKGNQQLNGCNSSVLNIDITDLSQEGKYRCYIHNSAGEVWSNETFIKVHIAEYCRPSVKIALLISNQLYNNLSHLYKPENDVNTLSCLLKNLGFLVIALQNLNLIEMRNSIYMFAKLLPSDAYVIFYFAGHGFEIQDKFMLPIDIPPAEEYLRSDAICERELLKALFLELLDMCLKPPISTKKKIFQETSNLYEYEADNNLIQGYSTTSYLCPYEKKTVENGLYVECLKRYLMKEKNFRFTDPCHPSSEIQEKFDKLSSLPKNLSLKFDKINIESQVTFSLYLNTFFNTLEISLTNLNDYRVTCEALEEKISFTLIRKEDVIIHVKNVQRLIKDKSLTLHLMKNDEIVDTAFIDVGKPLIAVADLWKKDNFNVGNLK
ncbi:hypothetical protein Phum_PHUM197620 [Pediculus humanus corporis]|uniref:Mucosa-associated lymphoid tissue lymphoma translocation protein n=1 Tax=Pediculus humanus subsp. corporis TaxID=121224 RepID=E0VH22_PEDHC|nr:uncharacterized protein Phum_PHUM197620 [Pediculus humanus corporis]EEB12678.1 hypothetical protein Phum_PHUM197620 [Pediculus humanus corporis]